MNSPRWFFSSFLVLVFSGVVACGSSTTSQGSGLTRGDPGASADGGDEGATANGSVDGGARTLSYSNDIQPIWDEHCNQCHSERAPLLTRGKSYTALTKGKTQARCASTGQVPYVVPGEPAQSFLFYKLTGEAAFSVSDAECKRPMPANPKGGGTPLAQIDGEA